MPKQSMRRFFAQNIQSETLIEGQEAKHIARVLRMQIGDELMLFDGSGMEYLCKIQEISESGVLVLVLKSGYAKSELPVFVSVYQAVIKSDHLDWATQKCTEEGASAVCLFLSDRCVKRPDEKSAAKLTEREKRIAAEAAKQCGRAKIPVLEGVLSIDDIVKRIGEQQDTLFLLAYEDEQENTIKQALKAHKQNKIAVVIGPEGGFSAKEAEALTQAGAVSCTLGKLILRAETAGVAATAMIAYEWME